MNVIYQDILNLLLIPRTSLSKKRNDDFKRCLIFIHFKLYIYIGVDVVEWSKVLDVRLSEWCCSVSMVWVQIPSRGEQKFDSSKI